MLWLSHEKGLVMAFAPIIAMGLAGAGTAMSVFGQIQQGRAAPAQGKYMSKYYKAEARAEERKTKFDYSAKKSDVLKQLALQRATFAAMVMDYKSGSMRAIGTSSINEAEKDLFAILYGGGLRKRSMLSQAGYAKAQGRASYQSSLLSAGATAIEGAGTVASMVAED